MPTNTYPLSRRRFVALSASTAATAALAVQHRGVGARRVDRQTNSGALPNTIARDASPQFRAVAEALMHAMAESQVPGAALGIYHDGKQELAAFGVADITANEAVTPSTRFQMGSITKTYTATAIMRLADAGRLDLEAPVRAYLPDLHLADPEVAEQVTSRHLLTHTQGWYGDILFRGTSDDDAIARLVQEKLPTLPQVAPLGALYSYNNTGFALLGRLVEVVTGRPYREAMQDLVLGPLGLESAMFGEVQGGSFAQSHGVGKSGVEVVTPLLLPRAYEPTGGLWTAIADQLRYARFHLGDGSLDGVPVLLPETLRLMQTAQVPMPGSRASAGMNWLITDWDGQRRLQHAGQTFGQLAQLVLVPEQQFAVAVLTNSSNAAGVMAAGIGGAIAQYLGFDPRATQGSSQSEASSTLSAGQLAEFAGDYSVPDLRFTIRPGADGLVFSAELTPLPDQELGSILPELPRDAPVTFVGPDTAVAGTPPGAAMPFAFVRTRDGSIGWLVSDGRLYPRTGPA